MLGIDGSIVLPFVYDEVRKISRNILLVLQKDKYGLISINNDNLKELIPCEYSRVTSSYSGKFIIEKNGKLQAHL